MKVGILKTGRPPRPAIPQFGTYPDMFMRLLGPGAYDWRVYAADDGELPSAPEDCAAYIVTGSAAAANPFATSNISDNSRCFMQNPFLARHCPRYPCGPTNRGFTCFYSFWIITGIQ